MSASAMLAALPPGLVWQADRLARPGETGLPTGFAALDAQLPGGGWPRGALIELLADSPGIGELGLLLPVMRTLSAERWIAWIAPPHLPYAPALAAAGVPLEQLLLLEPANHAESLWTIRQALASGGCRLVLAWLARADTAALRRLQLAAEESGTPLFLFRPAAAALQSSPASLRLRLAAEDGALAIDILKRRGPALAAPIRLSVPERPGRRRRPPAANPPTPPNFPPPPNTLPLPTSDALVCADPARPAAAGVHARRG
jgi:protein ImuA